jgi:hypothetical protein
MHEAIAIESPHTGQKKRGLGPAERRGGRGEGATAGWLSSLQPEDDKIYLFSVERCIALHAECYAVLSCVICVSALIIIDADR